MEISMTLNGIPRTFEVPPGMLLGELLRREGLSRVQQGPEAGDGGALAVLVEGRSRNPEIMLAAQAHGRSVLAGDAAGTPEEPEPEQETAAGVGTAPWGCCTPATLASAYERLFENPRPPA